MKTVDVLGFSSNFEGLPAITVARILAKLEAGVFAIHESVWAFPLLESACLSPLTIDGKHPGEAFRVRYHRDISFPRPSPPPPAPRVHLHTSLSRESVGTLLAQHQWTVGAINFDEDLHFSSFYLRQSVKAFAPNAYLPFAYTTLLAVNEDFNETYYIPQSQCDEAANALLQKLRIDPPWLDDILSTIRHRATALRAVFPDEPVDISHPIVFDDYSLHDLLAIYRRHNALHTQLYEVARIPEALDRGAAIFTRYLKKQIQDRLGPHAVTREVNRYFEVLTFPEDLSAPFHELEEFQQLLDEIKANASARQAFARGAKRAVLQLDPSLRNRIATHRNRWSYLGYHGYGSRALPDIQHYVNRIRDALGDQPGDTQRTRAHYRELLERSETARQRAFADLGLDAVHQHLFRLHSRVGLAKLFRRHIQLRNFYFLDALLAAAARRLRVPEGVVRCLLPEELDLLLSTGAAPSDAMTSRAESGLVLYLIDGDTEAVLSGSEWRWLLEELRARTRAPARQGDRLRGDLASGGLARGRARILIRPSDAEQAHFRDGDIIVSESTDPDLRDLIARSGGVVTEAGGATCHAAIVCREVGIPALVGVDGALDVIRNDDVLVLNADDGYVRVVTRQERSQVIDDFRAWSADESLTGAKARTLSDLLRHAINVPRFFVVPLEAIRSQVLTPTPDAAGPTTRALLDDVADALEYLRGDLFIIRSSLKGEDGATQSGAGRYRSESMVERRDVPSALIDIATELFATSNTNSPPRGGFIVQEMVLADVSGVCFTLDPRGGSCSTRMLLEAVPGGNEDLTGGRVLPIRYVVERSTSEISPEDSRGEWLGLLPPDLLRKLLRHFLHIEDIRMGVPQDIEWCVKGDDIFTLQARPVTGRSGDAVEAPVEGAHVAPRLRKISSVYRAYRVPPNLQMHLLRVAAVGATICDNWTGPPVDRHDIVVTLLLHDVGNIVKSDYERLPHLFPEEWRNLAYWKAVQVSVRERFGDNDLVAAVNIAIELGVPERIVNLLRGKQFVSNVQTLASEDWALKICAYSDQRVSPLGVRPLAERLWEAKARYVGLQSASVNDSRFDELVACALRIEDQLSVHTSIALRSICDETIASLPDALRDYTLERRVASEVFHK